MLPPPEKFSGGFSDRDIKRFSSPDLPDPHHHAPPLATTTTPQPPSTSISSPPPWLSRSQHHHHHRHSHTIYTTITISPRHRHHHRSHDPPWVRLARWSVTQEGAFRSTQHQPGALGCIAPPKACGFSAAPTGVRRVVGSAHMGALVCGFLSRRGCAAWAVGIAGPFGWVYHHKGVGFGLQQKGVCGWQPPNKGAVGIVTAGGV
ncbi:hypothetical protein Tco_1354701 [Tanacetum coccineum]